ncbi:hypothetical protein SAMN02745216_00452 [Desulfatibacillum alkenivorans DSM 16219]|jgi:hypothetical protein|uniref:Uncharacterized protein n=1 Tax=Desulfatibacillum alkenivorans DSM 16219 TaxID=1121393 RepID=A0A1M6DTF7_9BACT|nr:hypothetical protein [Desulfatibacillum alkenivorans]SHI76419.1 hypothetical protein SAMN02745216_00452 [Desulfatibacillum alkenivorans DSM 16219]
MLRNVLSIVLSFVILAAACPSLHKDGFAPDSRTDLMESIRAVASLSRSAETSTNFKNDLTQALTALSKAAGLTHELGRQGREVSHGVQNADALYLPGPDVQPGVDGGAAAFSEKPVMFSNRTIAPPFRPPKA